MSGSDDLASASEQNPSLAVQVSAPVRGYVPSLPDCSAGWWGHGLVDEQQLPNSSVFVEGKLTGLGKLGHMRVSLLGLIWVVVGW